MDAGALLSSEAGFGISSRGQKRKIQLFINRFSALQILMQPQRGGGRLRGADWICIEFPAVCVFSFILVDLCFT